jgi:glutathione S-transferase
MKLYYSPGACSLSPHIVLREAGLPFALVKADLKKGVLEDGTALRSVNSKGYVPVLETDDGERLTEGPAIVQYLADRVPERGLAPANGTLARYRLQEWLNFITSELHKQFSPLFDPSLDEAAKDKQRQKIGHRLEWLDKQLAGHDFLTGSRFTVADAYLFTVLGWGRWTGIALDRWPTLQAYVERVSARPSVQDALRAEGLLK